MSQDQSSTKLTRFLIISDTHNFEFDSDSPIYSLNNQQIPKVDVLLHCGDLTNVGGALSYKKALKMLKAFDADLKLVIAGNHDLDLDGDYWKSHLDDGDEEEDHSRAIDIMTGPFAAQASVVYLEEGTHLFTLKNGAKLTIYASPQTPAFNDWAFAYEHSKDCFNEAHQVADGITSIATTPIPAGVDIVMTHGPPKGILDNCSQGNVGCPNLLQAVRRVRPLMHCFGHVHEGHGAKTINWESAESTSHSVQPQKDSQHDLNRTQPLGSNVIRGHQTLMINGAIMDEKNRPVNAPWLVGLNLPETEPARNL